MCMHETPTHGIMQEAGIHIQDRYSSKIANVQHRERRIIVYSSIHRRQNRVKRRTGRNIRETYKQNKDGTHLYHKRSCMHGRLYRIWESQLSQLDLSRHKKAEGCPVLKECYVVIYDRREDGELFHVT